MTAIERLKARVEASSGPGETLPITTRDATEILNGLSESQRKLVEAEEGVAAQNRVVIAQANTINSQREYVEALESIVIEARERCVHAPKLYEAWIAKIDRVLASKGNQMGRETTRGDIGPLNDTPLDLALYPERPAMSVADDALDAARYRWLRECRGIKLPMPGEGGSWQWLFLDDADRAVDAAREGNATGRENG